MPESKESSIVPISRGLERKLEKAAKLREDTMAQYQILIGLESETAAALERQRQLPAHEQDGETLISLEEQLEEIKERIKAADNLIDRIIEEEATLEVLMNRWRRRLDDADGKPESRQAA